MSKRLILSPAAAGKTHRVLDLARKKAGTLHVEVRVCVPTGLQERAWRDRLAGAGGALGIHVHTFDRLVVACLDTAGESYTELSEPVQFRVLRTIIGRLPLVHYAPLKQKPGFIQVVQRVISELKSGLIDPEQFTRAVAALGDEPRLRELAGIYTAYQQQLQEQGWADRVGLHWLAVEALEERALQACRDWPLVVIDGFDDFTPSQLALLKLLAARADDFLITLPQAEQVTYPRYENTRRDLEAALGITGGKLPFSDDSRHPALRHLARQIFTLSLPESRPSGEAVTLREAPDRAAEVRTAMRWLKQRIVWEGISADQAALLARDITPYRPYIRQIAAEFGLPLRLAEGLPLWKSPIINALLELLRLFLPAAAGQGPNLLRRQLISAWRSPYFVWQNGDLAITAADADLLDMLAREQRVILGLDQWQAAFTAGMAKPDDIREEDEESGGRRLMGETVARLADKFDYFLTIAGPPPDANSMHDFVRWLERLIGPDPTVSTGQEAPPDSIRIIAQARANQETAEADVAALRTLKEILRGLVWAEEAVGENEPVNFVAFFSELYGAVLATHFRLPARPGVAEITVASAAQVRGLSFEAVAIMGLSEGSFPATISEDPFLRDIDREQLRERFSFPLASSTQSAEREFFYEAVSRPRSKLLLTRPILAENGAEWVASPYWEAVLDLTGSTPQSIPSEAVLAPEETASRAEWWETAATRTADVTLAQEEDPLTWAQIETAAHIWRARLSTHPSIWEGDLVSLAARLAQEHGPDTIWSPSRLELYRQCGYLFYLRYILGLEPRPEPAEGLDARQLGSLYHNIFEQVTRVDGLDTADEEGVLEAVMAEATPILDAAPESEGFRETAWWSQTRQEIVENVASSIVALGDGAYEFLQSELAFGFKGRPPLVIKDGGDRLQLRGFIDRVDRTADGRIRIIDYKLAGRYRFNARAFAEGKKLQLPLYALAAQQTLRLGPVQDGFYWHFRQVEESSFTLAKADGGVEGAVETAVAHAWDAVKKVRDGWFVPRPPDEGCPDYCPAAAFCWRYSPRSY